MSIVKPPPEGKSELTTFASESKGLLSRSKSNLIFPDKQNEELEDYFKRLSHYFGPKFLILIGFVYFGLKGLVFNFITAFLLPFYKQYGVEGSKYQLYLALAFIPWSIKPFFGFMSDTYPLGGYHKRYYCLISCFIGIAASFILTFYPFSEGSIYLTVFLVFCMCVELALCDLLIEAKYTEIMRENPETKSDVVTFVWMNNTMGSLIGTVIVGVTADHVSNIQPYFLLTLPFQFFALVPLYLGYLDEEYIPNPKFRWDLYEEQKNLFHLALIFSTVAIVLIFVSLWCDNIIAFIYATCAFVLICVGFLFALPRVLSHFLIYTFLHNGLLVELSGALSYFFLAGPDCVPGGPHFDYQFFQVTTAFVSTASNVVGLYIFQSYVQNWNVRHQLWLPLLILIASNFINVALVERWNLAWGISDKYFFILGDGVVQSVVAMLVFMPTMVLVSKFCPPKYEGTVFALSASTSNFGGTVSSVWGTFLLEAYGVKSTKPCDFSALPNLIFYSRMLVPLILIPLTFLLVPDLKFDEFVKYEEEDSHDESYQRASHVVEEASNGPPPNVE